MLGGGKEICLVGTIVWMMVSFIVMGNRLEMGGVSSILLLDMNVSYSLKQVKISDAPKYSQIVLMPPIWVL